MLSSKVLNILYLLRNNPLSYSNHVKFLSTSQRILNFMKGEGEEEEKEERKLKEWRQPLIVYNANPERKKDKAPYDPDKGFFGIFKVKFPLTPWGMKKFLKKSQLEVEREQQKFNQMRYRVLGFDLALAHFLIYREGKVKFKGHKEWMSLKTDKLDDVLPKFFDADYIVEEVDASNIMLFYDALQNFENAKRVKRAIFRNSPLFDDWFMDKISTSYPRLEYLDVSECPKLTERGLEGLYRAGSLKNLIITNYSKSAAFELTCMMLEDCLPKLKIEILDPPREESVVNKI